ncbi:two pore domain potassium channel family protein [Paeniclostridium sordellii]|uniref:potassium channel family protein n=1 Tax=Paraclostridium sordellii TaxID=1505 RepID=UPI0012ECE0D5|nr:potassium channel family protein [Paeniclostridium sordellii]MDU2686288.1 potassium channel family protein [Paeniclostridium sordellii]MVO71667.1 two pore domain potassium channel family protein [Paeniclostridium sordellii]
MGRFIITVVTILTFIVLIARNRKIDKHLKKRVTSTFKAINKTYIEIFKQKQILSRLIQGALLFFAEVSSFVGIYTTITKHLELGTLSGGVEFLLKGIITIICFIIVHYSIGYMLYLSLKIQSFINTVEHKNLKVDFILSYFMISTYLTILVLFPKEFIDNVVIGLLGMGVCYYLNIKTLITIIANPYNIKSMKKEDNGYSRIIIASILILLMLIINLYLIVCLINGLEKGAFLNANTNFDLFYYTVITFTTIGYGDIIPTTVLAKIASMLISVTSVVCLSVFLSSVLSYKDELSND